MIVANLILLFIVFSMLYLFLVEIKLINGRLEETENVNKELIDRLYLVELNTVDNKIVIDGLIPLIVEKDTYEDC